MNCPSRTDEPPPDAGWNQNPPTLAADLTTRQDLNGIVNARSRHSLKSICTEEHGQVPIQLEPLQDAAVPSHYTKAMADGDGERGRGISTPSPHDGFLGTPNNRPDAPQSQVRPPVGLAKIWQIMLKFGKFVGPGFMIAVAYIDPGNYSTDVVAGASKKFSLLFIVLMSNVFAIVLQSLAIRLGTVTGLNLAEHCRAHLPRWLNIGLYILGECAIIATDIAEVWLIRVKIYTNTILIIS